MVSPEIEHIITKYLFQTAIAEELDVLEIWIQNPGNEVFFKEYIRTHFAITLSMNDPDIEQIRQKLMKEIRKDEKSFCKFRFKSFFLYAAIAVFIMGLGYFIQQELSHNDPITRIIPKEDDITLELSNGDVEVISLVETSREISQGGNVIGVQHGLELVYSENSSDQELGYNTLNVPKGKQFSVKLSDGTKVYLNAESSIKYPVSISTKKLRQVFLTGEAYFEVAHNSDSPFMVNMRQLDIKVHGTTFNVSNYPEDESIEVVLIEGSVSMIDATNKGAIKDGVFLEPDFKGNFNKEERKITKEKANTAIYTSWRNGNLVFRDLSFEKIIQKLERNYNVTIINNNKKLGHETFNATIETQNETIEQVFDYFNKVYQIDYKVVGDKIIIN